MRKYNNFLKDTGYLAYRWISPVIDPIKFFLSFFKYAVYFKDWIRYSTLKSSEKIHFIDTNPCLFDNLRKTPFDSMYFYQDIWAFKCIKKSGVKEHVDVGSKIDFVGFLTAICNVVFVDIRPLEASLENYKSIAGNILSLPFSGGSVNSISCLNVAEHIGLGRYGDALDPDGTKKACAELERVLMSGGNLYFSVPLGKPRLCFNAHRIHSPAQIFEYFKGLKLVELSGINDRGEFIKDIESSVLEKSDFACGLFHFTK